MESVRRPSPLLPFLVIVVAFGMAGLSFLIPVVHKSSPEAAVHWRAAAGTAIMFLYIGASLIFLSGVKSFKSGLRLAYRLIALGILSFSAALVQLVIWGVFDLWDSAWAASGSGLLPYVATAGLIYFGTRKFVRLLGVRTILNSFLLVFGLTAVIGILFFFAAHNFITYNIPGSDVYIGVAAWCSSYLLISSIMVYKIYRSIGSYYQPAMRWMTVGMTFFTAAAWHETLNTFWFNNGDTYTDWGWYLIPWFFGGFFLLRAAYEFRKLPAPGNAASAPASNAPATDRDYVDSVVAVAGLASRPAEIDDILDELRLVTSTMKPGASLSGSDRQRLVKTYHQLETYLANKDPLRTFDKDELMTHVTPAFRSLLAKA